MMWEMWKKGFDAWEASTAQLFERALESPSVLEPAGAMLTAAMKAKVAHDAALARWWAMMGLATRRDQERAMHALNQLQSRLIDLEEAMQGSPKAGAAAPGGVRADGAGGPRTTSKEKLEDQAK